MYLKGSRSTSHERRLFATAIQCFSAVPHTRRRGFANGSAAVSQVFFIEPATDTTCQVKTPAWLLKRLLRRLDITGKMGITDRDKLDNVVGISFLTNSRHFTLTFFFPSLTYTLFWCLLACFGL